MDNPVVNFTLILVFASIFLFYFVNHKIRKAMLPADGSRAFCMLYKSHKFQF